MPGAPRKSKGYGVSDLIDRKALERDRAPRCRAAKRARRRSARDATSQEVARALARTWSPEGYLRQAMLEEQTRPAGEEAAPRYVGVADRAAFGVGPSRRARRSRLRGARG